MGLPGGDIQVEKIQNQVLFHKSTSSQRSLDGFCAGSVKISYF
jgi:hypothetical protein